jgi:hypothetical protein
MLFGPKIRNIARDQHIAHLIPAGPEQHHKHWLNVACAVLGIESSAPIDVKKKAARGCKMGTNNTRTSEQQDIATSTRNATNLSMGDSTINKGPPRMAGTGVLRFVANKIRLKGQVTALDGINPT